MVQFGIAGDPALQAKFKNTIQDDPVKESNKRGYVLRADVGAPIHRSTADLHQLQDNGFLDSQRFAPFGEVTSGMDAVEKINAESGEKPNQGSIRRRGTSTGKASFPKLGLCEEGDDRE